MPTIAHEVPARHGAFSALAGLVHDSISGWMDHKAQRMGAALAYYTAFSLAPLIILLLSVISLFMKRDDAAKRMVAQISDLVGADGGQVVSEILKHAGSINTLSWSTALSFCVLWVSASGAFSELQDSLNTIWEVPERDHPWIGMIKDRLLSLSMVFVLGFFLIVSLVMSMFITGLTDWWASSASKIALEGLNTLVSLIVISGLFACVFRMLPDVELTWTDALPGAVVSSVLFIVGKFLLGFYISHSAFASSYGAAASFIVILFWVFYSAQILYFGAEFTRAYTRRFGSHRDEQKPPLKKRVRVRK